MKQKKREDIYFMKNKRRKPSILGVFTLIIMLIAVIIISYGISEKGSLSGFIDFVFKKPPPSSGQISSPGSKGTNQSTSSPSSTDNNANLKSITFNKSDIYKGNLVLINADKSLPDGFIPDNLVNVYDNMKAGAYDLSTTFVKLQKPAFDALNIMVDDAKKDNSGKFLLISGYRTFEKQQSLLNDQIKQYTNQGFSEKEATTKALMEVARPGHSEHNYGLAIDMGAMSSGVVLSEAFQTTTQGKWLYSNCWKYGFIIRFTSDKSSITGIIYEPWHIRYVGETHSKIISDMGFCLEEYIDYIKTKGSITIDKDGQKYCRIYYVKASKENANWETTIKLPKDGKYEVSGDGSDGFIVTAYGQNA